MLKSAAGTDTTEGMKRYVLTVFAVACLGWGALGEGLDPANRSVPIDGVASFVNDRAITISDVLSAMQPVQARLIQAYEGEELTKRLREAYEDALRTLIERDLILDAYKQQKTQLPEWAIDNRINEIIGDQFGGDRSALNDALQKDRLTYEEWRDDVRNHLIVQYMHSGQVDRNVAVSPSAVRAEYDRHPDRYREPVQVKLRMIVLKTGKGAMGKSEAAEAIRRRALAGEDFSDLAREVSEGTKAQDGGDWGWMEPTLLRREIADALESMVLGDVSEVIETDDDLYVVKLDDHRPARVVPFNEVQTGIERELRRKESDARYQEWVGRLWDSAYVKIMTEDPF